MLRVDPEIELTGAQRLRESDNDELQLACLLRSDTPDHERQVREAIEAVYARVPEDVVIGSWSSQPSRDGVLIGVDGEPDGFTPYWRWFVGELERRSVAGQLDLIAPVRLEFPRRSSPSLYGCAMCRGERTGDAELPGWLGDAGAVRSVAVALGEWCCAQPGQSLIDAGYPRQELFDPRRQIEHALDGGFQSSFFQLSNFGPRGRWSATVWPRRGWVGLGAEPAGAGTTWTDALEALRESMLVDAGSLAYAAVTRTEQLDMSPVRISQIRAPRGLLDSRMPDIYAWQLLGPGYKPFPTAPPGFGSTRVDDEHIELVADDLAAWAASAPDLDLLTEPRRVLREILISAEG